MGSSTAVSRLSDMFSPMRALPIRNSAFFIVSITTSDEDLHETKPLATALAKFTVRFRDQPELCKAVRALLDFVRNLRLLPAGSSTVEQYRVLASVRSWLSWCPTAILGLGTRQLPILTVMAFYHAVLLAAESYLPATSTVLFAHRLTDIIGDIHSEILRVEEACTSEHRTDEIRETLEDVAIPLLYAVRYRKCHAANRASP